MSIRVKLITGALLFLLLFVAVFVASTVVSGEQKSDGLVINIVRGKRTIVCGDPQQLGHVSFVSDERIAQAGDRLGR